MSHFGEHLTYDGYGANPALLDDRASVLSALTDLVTDLNMTVLGGPEVYLAQARTEKDPGGWTGMVILQESHISIHTFPARGFVSADVFTCQNGLDVDAVRNHFHRCFGVADEEVNFLRRGTRYPRHDLYPDRVRSPEPVIRPPSA